MEPRNEAEAVEKLKSELSTITEEAGSSELWGEDLRSSPAASVLLAKFVRANEGHMANTRKQLLDTLKWRKEFRASATIDEEHDPKFNGVGFVEQYKQEIVTWNIYGKVKDLGHVFGDLQAFLRWRVSIMERGLKLLDWRTVSQIAQVHDYQNVSFLRIDPRVRKASKEAIDLFARYYPELLSKKYFVNVPMLMTWVYSGYKAVAPVVTASKLVMVANGRRLAQYLGDDIPEEYGGHGAPLRVSEIQKQGKDGQVPPPASDEFAMPLCKQKSGHGASIASEGDSNAITKQEVAPSSAETGIKGRTADTNDGGTHEAVAAAPALSAVDQKHVTPTGPHHREPDPTSSDAAPVTGNANAEDLSSRLDDQKEGQIRREAHDFDGAHHARNAANPALSSTAQESMIPQSPQPPQFPQSAKSVPSPQPLQSESSSSSLGRRVSVTVVNEDTISTSALTHTEPGSSMKLDIEREISRHSTDMAHHPHHHVPYVTAEAQGKEQSRPADEQRTQMDTNGSFEPKAMGS